MAELCEQHGKATVVLYGKCTCRVCELEAEVERLRALVRSLHVSLCMPCNFVVPCGQCKACVSRLQLLERSETVLLEAEQEGE